MLLSKITSWPETVIELFDEHCTCVQRYFAYEQKQTRDRIPGNSLDLPVLCRNPDYEDFHSTLAGCLCRLKEHFVTGWHCARLTLYEIQEIENSGMQLPNGDVLRRRINRLLQEGEITPDVARELNESNQADDGNRRDRIWFLFYEPKIAGQQGISRFFNSWGGEALYNSHERQPDTGRALRRIGIPCVIEVNVRVDTLGYKDWIPEKMARHYIREFHNFDSEESVKHEDFTTASIPVRNVLRCVCQHDDDFEVLTGSENWMPPLAKSTEQTDEREPE